MQEGKDYYMWILFSITNDYLVQVVGFICLKPIVIIWMILREWKKSTLTNVSQELSIPCFSFSFHSSYVNNLQSVWKPLYTMVKGSERVTKSENLYGVYEFFFVTHFRDIPLYIYATAGMRVLSESDQKLIYDAIFKGFSRSDLHFYMSRDMIRTINGMVN